MRKKTTKPAALPKAAPKVETVDLDENASTKLELAHSRAESAQNLLAARKSELDHLLTQVRTHYEENGKYVVTGITTATRKVERVLASEVKEAAQPFREPAGSAPSGGDQPKG